MAWLVFVFNIKQKLSKRLKKKSAESKLHKRKMRVKENVTERNIQQCLNSLVRLKGAAGRCQHQPFTATMLKKYLKKKNRKKWRNNGSTKRQSHVINSTQSTPELLLRLISSGYYSRVSTSSTMNTTKKLRAVHSRCGVSNSNHARYVTVKRKIEKIT